MAPSFFCARSRIGPWLRSSTCAHARRRAPPPPNTSPSAPRCDSAGEIAALFTCYGIGVATKTLGGEVTRAYPEDTGPTTVRLTDAGRDDALFGSLAHTFTALTAHKEGVGLLPDGAVLLAENDGCPVQAYRVGERLYATQFHPEPTGRAFTERMAVYRDDGYFAAHDYERIAADVLAASLTQPPRILRAFATTF
jgi:GMP synthase (glutamine-hydrolysing)